MIENAGNVPEDKPTMLLDAKNKKIEILEAQIEVLSAMYDKVHTERNSLKQRVDNFNQEMTFLMRGMGS